MIVTGEGSIAASTTGDLAVNPTKRSMEHSTDQYLSMYQRLNYPLEHYPYVVLWGIIFNQPLGQ